MTKPFTLAITGPTGSGKTTVAKKLARDIEKSVNIDVDHVKHFIVNGFIYDESPAGVKQWELLGENIGLLGRNFHQQGYNVIINGYINEPAWRKLRNHIKPTHKVMLLPDVAQAMSRDTGRDAEFRMGQDMVKKHHAYFSSDGYFADFSVIDSTKHSVDETVALIRSQNKL